MFTFGENQPGTRRLPARGPRFRRPVDRRPATANGSGARSSIRGGCSSRRSRATNPQRLRPDAARPRAGQLRGPRGALRAAAERLGRAGRQLGRRPRRAGADPDARRDQRQHRRLLGARQRRAAPGKPLEFAYRMRWQARGHGAGRQGLGRADAARPRLTPGSPTATSTSSSTSTARRCARWPPTPKLEPVVWVDANAEVRERNLFKNPVSGAWRMTVRVKRTDAAKPVELRAYLQAGQQTIAHRDMELHPSARRPDKP